MVFDRMDIDTREVIEAMNTKWNALGFYPGLVGGHCIGVDPYYFVYEAEKLGYHSQIILAGRKINDDMPNFAADAIIKQLVLANKKVRQAKVLILGITFKENCPDTRNSKVNDIILRLNEFGIRPLVADPWADPADAKREYGIDLVDWKEVRDADCVVFAVAHDSFKSITRDQLDKLFKKDENEQKVVIDIKSILPREEYASEEYRFWRL